VTGFWDRLLAGPVWWDNDGGLFWIGIRHGVVGVTGVTGGVLQLLVYKVFHGQVVASMLTPGDWGHRPTRMDGWNWQVGFLIWMRFWHGDDW